MILRRNHPVLCYIEFSPRSLSPVPAVRAAGMQKKLSSLSSAFPPERKSVPRTCAGFLLHFLSRHCKLPFAVCIYTSEENEGLQREHPFAAGFPIGARSIPVGTRFCSAKSSVLYLCFRLTRERGWRRTLRCGRVWRQTLFRGSRTGGFCDVSYSTKSAWPEKEVKVYKARRSGAPPVFMASLSEAYPATDPPAISSGFRSDENESPRQSACARYHP